MGNTNTPASGQPTRLLTLDTKAAYAALRATPKAGAKAGFDRVLDYLSTTNVTLPQAAYILATVWHETAQWMQPIREGATRYGTSYSDANAKAAVASIYAKGIIRTNYALPAGPYKQSYYGRGLVQITWYDNYAKFSKILGIPLDRTPDLALEWDTALDITYVGMRDGIFRGKKLSLIRSEHDFIAARDIINGDTKKNGPAIAGYAKVFLHYLTDVKG